MGFKPEAVAFWMSGGPIADDDPLRAVKERALALDAAAEILGQVTRDADTRARAAVIGEVVEALGVESIDIAELLDASGLDEPGRDAACYLALSLKLAELGELGDDAED